MSARCLAVLACIGTVLVSGAPGRAEPQRLAGGVRTLVILLDAVPYTTMARLTEERGGARLFGDFEPPVPLISTFPSSTSIALGGILGGFGLERSPGYEARFFDWEGRRRRGGGPLSYFRIRFPWREFFDWNRKGPVRNALHAARPVRSGIRELRRALAAFEASGDEMYTIYVADTDTAAHLHGPEGLDPILRALDADLRRLRARMVPEPRIVLLSDHGLSGGERLRNVLPAVRRGVHDGGWRLVGNLRRESDVVLTPYGLVSSLEAYAAPSQAPALSLALAGVEGVDLCVSPSDGGWRVDAARYAVTFERRSGAAETEWRWRVEGEPGEGLAGVLSAVGPPGRWTRSSRLLAATREAEYPDPLNRLAYAFSAVDNPASVVCSVDHGFMYGSRMAERTARWAKGALRWTHGALHRDASLGFLMTSSRRAAGPVAVRYDEALASTLPRIPLWTGQ